MANYQVVVEDNPITFEYNICFISSSGFRFNKQVTLDELISGKHRTLQGLIDEFIEECLERI